MKSALKLVLKINDAVGKAEAFFLCIFLMSMVVLAFAQVVARNVFNAGFPWADTVVKHLVLWVGFLGAALATKLDQNLTLEVLTKYMPDRAKHAAALTVKLFGVAICVFLFCAALRYMEQMASTGEQFLELFPSWCALSIIPLAFVLIPFHLLFTIARDLGHFVKGKKVSE